MPQLTFKPTPKFYNETIKATSSNSPYTSQIPMSPALQKEENMSKLPILFTPTEIKKEGAKLAKEPKVIQAQTQQPVAVSVAKTPAPIFKGKQPVSAKTTPLNPLGVVVQPQQEGDNGEYSTLRKIGTGLANFSEHFGNAMSGVGNAGVTNRWDAIKQQYREKAPNSNISKLYQDTYKKFGIDTKGKSAWDLKQMHPDIKYLQDQSQMENQMKLASMRPVGGGGGVTPKQGFIPNDKRFINISDNKIDASQQKEIVTQNASYNDFTNKMNRVEQINKQLGNSNATLTPFKSDQEKALIAERDAALKDAKYAYGTLKFGALRDSDMPRLDEMFPNLGTWTPQTEGTVQGKLQALRKNAANEYKSKMKAYGLEQVAPLNEDIEDELAKRAARGK